MYSIIASDDQSTAIKLRDALLSLGSDYQNGNILTTEETAQFLLHGKTQPDLLLFVLPIESHRCLDRLAQFRAATRARIIAVGSGNDAARILAAVHAGADDYLVEDQDFRLQLSSFLDRLTAKRETASPKGRLTIVASAGGGCGASVIASNLASLIARNGHACALFDFDIHTGDQAALLNLKPRHTLDELCGSLDSCDRELLEQSLTRHDSGVRLLAAPQRIADARRVSPGHLRTIARIGRALLQEIIVDVGSISDGGDPELLQNADQILLVFRCDVPGLRRLRLILDSLAEADVDTQRIQLIANRCGQSKKLPVAKIESALRRKVLLCLTDDCRRLNLSVDCGNPIVLETPKAAFAKSMVDLGTRVGLLTVG